MKKTVFLTISGAYLLLALATGYLSFFKFVGLATLPSPNAMVEAAKDQDFKQYLFVDAAHARDENAKLIDLAAHSFDVVLGAFLGFLSAVAAGIGLASSGTEDNSHGIKISPPAT